MTANARPLSSRLVLPILVTLCLAGAAGVNAAGNDGYPSFGGSQPIKAVFDVRTANPKSAVIFLELIHRSLTDPGLAKVDSSPELAVAFIGPAVRLITTSREGLSPEEAEPLDAIGARLAEMARDGIKLEFCLFAARLADSSGRLQAVLDIDSHQPAAFDELDRHELERLVRHLARFWEAGHQRGAQ